MFLLISGHSKAYNFNIRKSFISQRGNKHAALLYLSCRSLEQKLSMATSSRRPFLSNSNVFFYICGDYTLHSNRRGISEFVKCAYLVYFKVLLDDQDNA